VAQTHTRGVGIADANGTRMQTIERGADDALYVGRLLEELCAIARDSLAANIVQLGGDSYLTAGPYQFKSLWTRDFCFAVRGLLAIGRKDVVEAQLDALLDGMAHSPREWPNLVTRTMDSTSPDWRAFRCASHRRSLAIGLPLRSYHLDRRRQPAFDSNMLVVLAASHYRDAGGGAWWSQHREQLAAALSLYDLHRCDDGVLLDQPPFSDWQDSVQRRGATFYCNLLYACALEAMQDRVHAPAITALRRRIDEAFFDEASGLYRSAAAGREISLDGNLLALDLGYLSADRSRNLFQALRAHSLWTGPMGPGFATAPAYAAARKDLLDTLVGLAGYHDTLYWSWLMALSAKVASHYEEARGDVAEIVGRLLRVARRDRCIAEIYHPQDLALFESRHYKAELPFSWGAACVVDAVETIRHHGFSINDSPRLL
jgi:hypothetical protein